MLDILFLHTAIFFLLIFLFLQTGRLASSLVVLEYYQKAGTYFKLFNDLLIGTIVATITFALIKSQLKTVFLIFILALLYLLWQSKAKLIKTKAFNNFKQSLGIFFLLASVVFFTQFLLHWDLDGSIKIPSSDYLFYAQCITNLELNGNENLYQSLNFLYPDIFNGISLYHYFELWLAALVSKISQNAVFSLLFVAQPILVLCAFLGIIALWEHYATVKAKSILLTFLLLFLGARMFPFYYKIYFSGFNEHSFIANVSVFSYFGKKLQANMVIALWSANLFLRDSKHLALGLLCLLPLINITFFPAVVGTILLISFILMTKYKFRESIWRFTFIFQMIITLALLAVSILWGIKTEDNITLSNYFNQLFYSIDIHAITKNIIAMLMGSIILYLPLLALIAYIAYAWYKDKQNHFMKSPYWFILLLAPIPGLVLANILPQFDSTQLYTNILILSNILITIVLIRFLATKQDRFPNLKTISYFYFSLLMLINVAVIFKHHNYQNNKAIKSLYKSYSYNYLINTSNKLKNKKSNSLVAYFLSPQSLVGMKANELFRKQIGENIKLQGINNFLCINNLETLNQGSKKEKPEKRLFPFDYYIGLQKEKRKFVSIDESRIEFLKTFNINLLVCETEELPPLLTERYIIEKYSDPKSGQTLYILNWNQ